MSFSSCSQSLHGVILRRFKSAFLLLIMLLILLLILLLISKRYMTRHTNTYTRFMLNDTNFPIPHYDDASYREIQERRLMIPGLLLSEQLFMRQILPIPILPFLCNLLFNTFFWTYSSRLRMADLYVSDLERFESGNAHKKRIAF